MIRTREVAAIAALLACAGAAQADTVLDWNNQYLQAIRNVGGPPCPISRIGAMYSAAVFNAVNSINPTHISYGGFSFAPAPGASQEAAAATAAHRVLSNLYPTQTAMFDAQLATSLAGIPVAARNAGIAVGEAAANHIIAFRSGDGSEVMMPYTQGTNPGDYRTPSEHPPGTAFTPLWGQVTPFGLTSGSQFRPTRLTDYGTMANLLASPEYTANFNQVKAIGALDAETADRNMDGNPDRTPYQTQTGFFWAYDRDGTAKPPGQLNQITQVVSQDRGLSLQDNARLFALVNLAMGDAGVAAWDAKYGTPIDFWRPVAGIHEADTDGNPDTISEPTWQPLNPFTPPFPAYVSGHATFGAAHAAAMAAFFGTDNITFTIDSEDDFYTGGPRTFTSFSQAALENAESRLYLGVHWEFDATDGTELGFNVGEWAAANLLLPIPAPSAVGLAGVVGLMGLRRRRA